MTAQLLAMGVTGVCKAVKNDDNADLKNLAINMMVLHFAGIVEDESVVIPVPQHTGQAEYTKEITVCWVLINLVMMNKMAKQESPARQADN